MRRLLPLLLAACTTPAPVAPTPTPGLDAQIVRWTEAPRSVPPGPNLLLVVLCTARADQLSPWGAPDAVTPTLGELAGRGVAFETTVAQAPWTRPGAAAILTGAWPEDLGLTEPESGPNQRALPPAAITLAERLHDAGWTTVGLTANPNLNQAWGFDQGFEAYLQTASLMLDGDGARKVSGQQAAELLLQAASARPDRSRPVFLQAVLVDAHAPITASPDEIAAFAAPDVPRAVARYRAGALQADRAVKTLIEGLPGAGIDPDNTVIAVIGDHGEGLSFPVSHGPGHGYYLYPSAVHVPWLVAGPGVGHGRIGGLAAQIDLVPTVLGLLGLPAGEDLLGEDLSSAVGVGSGAATRPAAYTSTRFGSAQRSAVYTQDLQCQIDHDPATTRRALARNKLLPFADGCCRWREDPACDHPVWDEPTLDLVRTWSAARIRAHAAAEPVQVTPDAELKQQLEALGYAQ